MRGRAVLAAQIAVATAASACAALLGVNDVEYAAPDAASASDAPADGAGGEAGASDAESDAANDARASDGGADAACTACGACALPSAPGPACSASQGSCPVATLVDAGASDAGALATYPFGMAVDATYLYWVAQGDLNGGDAGVVLRAPKAGGAPPETLAVDSNAPITVAVDDTHLYWFSRAPLQVRRVPKNALPCGPCAQAENVLGPMPTEGGGQTDGAGIVLLGPDDVAILSDAHLFHVFKDDGGAWNTTQTVDQVIGNGSHVTRTRDGLFTLSTDRVTYQRTVTAFDLRGNVVGPPHQTPPDDASVNFVIGDCDNAWAGGPAAMWRLDDASVGAWTPHPVDGGTSYWTPAWAMGVDEGFFYVAGPGNGLWRVPRDGSRGPERMVDGDIWGLAVDDQAIYWGEHGGTGLPKGEIRRILKTQ